MSFTEIAIAVLGADALFHFIEWLIDRRDRKKKSPEVEAIKTKIDDIEGALKSILAENLNKSLNEWIHSDVRSHITWDIIADQYVYYHDKFKGNHGIEQLFEVAKDVPPTE